MRAVGAGPRLVFNLAIAKVEAGFGKDNVWVSSLQERWRSISLQVKTT